MLTGILLVLIAGLVSIVAGLTIDRKNLTWRLTQAEEEKTRLNEHYKQIHLDNERLRTYMDNQHMTWHPETSKSFFETPPKYADLVILISAQDLYNLHQSQWQEGYNLAANESGKRMQLALKNAKEQAEDLPENVHRINYSFADKKFDHDFAIFVNKLTEVAVKYAHAQQLRERMSYLTIGFRAYLKKKQDGEKAEFPKV